MRAAGVLERLRDFDDDIGITRPRPMTLAGARARCAEIGTRRARNAQDALFCRA
jgi:hypothetical protein